MKQTIKKILAAPSGFLNKREFETQTTSNLNERPIEYAFVFRFLSRFQPKNILDVGTGQTALPRLLRDCGAMVTAIDQDANNRYYHVIKQDITNLNVTKRFDIITCVSVLEHIQDHDAAIRSMVNALADGGHLIVTCPYNEHEYVPNVYDLENSDVNGRKIPFICQMFSRLQVDKWMKENDAEITIQEYWRIFSGEYWRIGQRLSPPIQTGWHERHHLTCLLIRKKRTT